VIHFDPWWNPAVEQQATDRAHRIGQTKVVTAYRLVAQGTIEEKILQLKAKKRELVASVLSEDAGGAKKLTKSDLEELFAVD
jgi:SNF2 family DNA or RNA helicase